MMGFINSKEDKISMIFLINERRIIILFIDYSYLIVFEFKTLISKLVLPIWLVISFIPPLVLLKS